MFYKHSEEGKIDILIVYVDDIILTGDDNVELERLKKKLDNDFEINDLGALKYLLECNFPDLRKVYLSLNINMYLIYLEKQGCWDAK
jgi:hypothetical protein